MGRAACDGSFDGSGRPACDGSFDGSGRPACDGCLDDCDREDDGSEGDGSEGDGSDTDDEGSDGGFTRASATLSLGASSTSPAARPSRPPAAPGT